jgi:hypothetical protein
LGVIPYPTAFNNGVKRHFEDDPKLRQELLFRSRCPREFGTVTKSGGNDLHGSRRISTRPLPAWRIHCASSAPSNIVTRRPIACLLWRLARNGVGLAVAQIEAGGFLAGKGSGAATAEDGDLVSTFIYGAVAVDSLRDGQCQSGRAVGGD